MKNRRTLMIVVLLVIAVTATMLVVTRRGPIVVTVVARQGRIEAYLEEQAVTQLPFEHMVAMPIDGWVEPSRLRVGDVVEEGAVLARLETEDLEARVAQAEQRIASIETEIASLSDNRLEDNALIEINATVIAVDEMVAAADARLEAVQAVLDFAEDDVERLAAMSEVQATSDRELREAERELRRARAEFRSESFKLAAMKTIAAVSHIGPKFVRDYTDRKSFRLQQRRNDLVEARATLAIEQRNLERASIRSPLSGLVLRRFQSSRQYLAAGTPLLEVGSLEDLEIVVDVLTERATRLVPGDRVLISGQAIVGAPISGTVSRIAPAGFRKISSLGIEQQRVNVYVAIDERPESLGTDYRVQVRIIFDDADDVVIVPRSSLIRNADQSWSIMLVRSSRIELAPVEVGIINDREAEIRSGVSEGDHVLTQPSREYESGMRARVEG